MVVTKSHQYAQGVTGFIYTCTVYIKSDDMGFSYAAEGYNALKDAGIKKIEIKGRKTPYGNIGSIYQDRKAVKISEFLDRHDITPYDPFIVYDLTVLGN